MSGFLQVVGIILLIPQGLVPLGYRLAGHEIQGWQLARFAPADLQIPASCALALAGVALILIAASAGKKPAS
ncbi:hypothetical protein [Actinopolymorpha alba]|uniref:hypothetical protein n=1 Tax=Actinopolymorpha alba TaxID=533267 RepID=UPI00037FF664|nr:hypothetical protein [Actinopolymorpha alba]